MEIKAPLHLRFLSFLQNLISTYRFSEKLFSKLRNKKLFFIQIGANDGVSQDPIFKYASYWEGILIEPIPLAFAKLKESYKSSLKNKVFENIAIGPKDGELSLFVPQFNKGNASFYSKIASPNKNADMLKNFEIEEIKVPCLSLNSLIKKHSIRKIDLLVIDVEGYELEIFNSYDFSIKPQVIFWETRFFSYHELIKANEKFLKLGYRIFPEGDNCLMILK